MKTVTHKQASVRIGPAMGLPEDMRGGVDEIIDLYVDHDYRGNGLATALMQRLCRRADTNGRVLMLQPKPFDGGMTEVQLTHWYTKFGFEAVQMQPIVMARPPRQ